MDEGLEAVTTGLDVIVAAYPTVAWEQAAPGRWRGRCGATDLVVLAVVDGGQHRTTWMGQERPEFEERVWQKLQARLDAARSRGRAWFASADTPEVS